MKLRPLIQIHDEQEFWRGTRFRQYEVGLNVESKKDDYYEYMLAEIPGENYMLLTCVKGYKAGIALALVKMADDKSRRVVKGKAVKYAMGIKDTFVIEE